jgi:uncharacterized protein
MTDKLTNLINILKSMKSVVLAYSGGVDSTFLLKALQISNIRFLAVTAVSEITPSNDLLIAKEIAEELGIEHRIINTKELLMEEFVSNTPERCFICKSILYQKLSDIAQTDKYMFILDASNQDDLDDYRPGRLAAEKYGIRSPLIETGFSKREIRAYSKKLGLSTWNLPSSSCLATRFPYYQRITTEALRRVQEAEDFLKSLGFQEIRLRDHGTIARIEVSKEKIRLFLSPQKRDIISKALKSFGYSYIALDLDGYQSGSMNRVLKK